MRIILMIVPLFLLSGCFSAYEENFDCPIGEGEKCSSLSKVNDLADAGKYTAGTDSPISRRVFVIFPGTNLKMESQIG